MAISMTRAEYQAKYGVAPVIPAPSKIDTTPAPRRMTKAEYDNEFVKTPTQKMFEQTPLYKKMQNPAPELASLPPLSESLKARKAASQSNIQDYVDKANEGGLLSNTKNALGTLYREGGNILGGAADIGFKAIEKVPVIGTMQKVVMNAFDKVVSGIANVVGDTKVAQKLVENISDEDFNKIASNLQAATDIGNAAMIAAGELKAPKVKIPTLEEARVKVREFTQEPTTLNGKTVYSEAAKKTATEIANVENNYVKLRTANEYAKDAEASRLRIAQSGVLNGAVDESGTIMTKTKGGAVEQYKKATIDGLESVVRDNLERLGEKVNLDQVSREIKAQIAESGLEGADLIAALQGARREIAGLRLKADEFGDIPLTLPHDAKINTTSNINFQTPPETARYRKAVARAYKKIVEDNSAFNVKEVNGELTKYYGDLERIENLDGRKVKGGKLGKYVAQVTGTIAGATLGSVGGFVGSGIGSIVGGEVGSFLKGKSMKGTLGEVKGRVAENAILEKAKADAKLGPQVDLTIPDAKVGASAKIVKTKEIYQVEKQIAKNVEAQKKAIKAKNYTLVSALKEVYVALVEKLKALIQKVKDTPNKEGGFIKNPLMSDKSSNTGKKSPRPIESKKLSSQDSTISPELSQEAKTLYHGTSEGGKLGIEKSGFTLDESSSRNMGAGSGNEMLGKGVYFTDSASSASSYGDSVVKAQIKPGTNIKSMGGDEFIKILQDNKISLSNKSKITKFFQDKGIDGIRNTDTKETVIFDPKNVITKPDLQPISQYTENGKEGKFWTTPEGADSGFGNIKKDAVVDVNRLYQGSSSYDFLEKRGLMTEALKKELDATMESDNPNRFYQITQEKAEKILKEEGYPGARWTSEDDLNPTQYQIWDDSVIKKNKGDVNLGAAGLAALAPFIPEVEAATTEKKNEVNLVPKEWTPMIKATYNKYPELKKYRGLIEAVLMQESSMGQNDSNYNSKIGESAWIGGLTEVAKKELEKKGIKVNLDTQAGVIDAIGAYLDLKRVVTTNGKSVEYKSPVNLYLQRYKTAAGIKLSKKQEEKFADLVNFYSK